MVEVSTDGIYAFGYLATAVLAMGVFGISGEGCSVLGDRSFPCPSRGAVVVAFGVLTALLALIMFVAFAVGIEVVQRFAVFPTGFLLVLNTICVAVASSPRSTTPTQIDATTIVAGRTLTSLLVSLLAWYAEIIIIGLLMLTIYANDSERAVKTGDDEKGEASVETRETTGNYTLPGLAPAPAPAPFGGVTREVSGGGGGSGGYTGVITDGGTNSNTTHTTGSVSKIGGVGGTTAGSSGGHSHGHTHGHGHTHVQHVHRHVDVDVGAVEGRSADNG